jgi:uncharacterized protein (TIGR02246 family)
MRTFLRRSMYPALIALVTTAHAAGQSSTSVADDKDIRSIGAQIQDAWNKADAKMLADLWLTDGDYVSSTGRAAHGRTEVQKAFAEQWATIYKGTKIAHTFTTVFFVRRDVAIADGSFEITGMRDTAGKILPARSGLSTIVAVKKGDRWYVAALRGMVPSVPAGASGR